MDVVQSAVLVFFGILIVLNTIDWVTTHLLLDYFRSKGPIQAPLPLWRITRPGKWLMRRRGFRWIKPAKMGTCHWYDHELNPLFRWGCKKGGLMVLGFGKLLPFILIANNTYTAVVFFPASALLYLSLLFYGLCMLYVFVVINNMNVIRKVMKTV